MDKTYLRELIDDNEEKEWIEYKENWFDAYALGEYISALSNTAAYHGQDYGYFIWGVEDKTRILKGTNFNPDMDIKNEPLKHYLARLLTPSIAFDFETFYFDDCRIVVLIIPAAKRVVTEFDKERYIRIGSRVFQLRQYPEKEGDLWVILRNGIPTILNTVSPKQDLQFSQLFSYYNAKGIPLREETFRENLGFYLPNSKKYNELAFLFSDQNDITCRVSIFTGRSKATNQYSLNDFGKKSMLVTVDQIMNFVQSLNIITLDEENRVVERKEKELFDFKSFQEALLNAFIHNDWTSLNAPMITIYSDRLEILSYGSLPSKQTMRGFFSGKSEPRCRELAEIFLQLRISERSGRGVPRIVDTYGRDAFRIEEDFIQVFIPFAFERSFGVLKENDSTPKRKSSERMAELENIILQQMRHNANVTTEQLMVLTGLKKTAVQNYLRRLASEKKIERVGSKKTGYWKVL